MELCSFDITINMKQRTHLDDFILRIVGKLEVHSMTDVATEELAKILLDSYGNYFKKQEHILME